MTILKLIISLCCWVIALPAMADQPLSTNHHQHEIDKHFIPDKNSGPLASNALQPNEVLMEVHGIVCSFCSQGVKKKLAKLTFIDRSRYNDGILMNIEAQRITIAIHAGETADIQAMFKAILSGGYEPIVAVISDATGQQTTIKAGR